MHVIGVLLFEFWVDGLCVVSRCVWSRFFGSFEWTVCV